MAALNVNHKRHLTVAYMDDEISRYIHEAIRRPPFELALREDPSRQIRSGVLLLCEPNETLGFAARIVRRRRVDRLRTKFIFEELIPSPPLPVEHLHGTLRTSQTGALMRPGGTFTDKAADRITELLERHDSEFAGTIANWRNRHTTKPAGSSTTIFEQRDATVMLFRMAGLQNKLVEPGDPLWEIRDLQKTYLTEVPLEDNAIITDMCSFLGWRRDTVDGSGIGTFSDGAGATLTVININRQPSEGTTGADLVYYHRQRRSFVHVQYKRMLRSSKVGFGGPWIYDEDRHFAKQLDALITLDRRLETLGAAASEYRLSPEAGYFKFTMMDDYGPGDAALVPGRYMGTRLLDSLRLTRNGRLRRLRDDDGTPYLTNTLFADLVGYGLIGSRGADVNDIRQVITELASTKEGTVLGIHSEDRPAQRSRERRAEAVDLPSDLGEIISTWAAGDQRPD